VEKKGLFIFRPTTMQNQMPKKHIFTSHTVTNFTKKSFLLQKRAICFSNILEIVFLHDHFFKKSAFYSKIVNYLANIEQKTEKSMVLRNSLTCSDTTERTTMKKEEGFIRQKT
jgi:hypothetical protein